MQALQSKSGQDRVSPWDIRLIVLGAREREAEREQEMKRKQEAPKGPPQPKNEGKEPQLTEAKRWGVSNPEAKLVLLDDLEVRHLIYAERHVGEVLAFPEAIVDKLDVLEMFNEKYGYQYMRKPMSMIRQNTGLVARELLGQDVLHLGTKDRRVIVSGKGGTGKSFILLQIAAMAL